MKSKKSAWGKEGVFQDFNPSCLTVLFLAWFSDEMQNTQFVFVLLPLPLNFWI